MSTHPWFPIPVYSGKAVGDEYKNIQTELSSIYDDLEFRQNPNWTDDTNDLSVGKSGEIFGDCILSERKCNHMLSFINSSVIQYLNDLGAKSKEYVITESWLTRTTKGKYAHLHDHNLCDISGVYYYKTNGKDGNIMFPNYLRQFGSNYVIGQVSNSISSLLLEQGVIGLWPSMLMHNTEPNTTDNDRVSVSFNIKFVV